MEIDRTILNFDEQAIFALRGLYNRFGYERYKMGRFEEYDLYVQNKDFLVSDQVITFTDRNGRLLAMKPDVTLSIIKNAPDQKGVIQKVYYNENVYRIADGSRNFREIMQAGLECIGDLQEYDIAEVVLLAAKSLQLICPRFVLDLSHMGLVSAVLQCSGLSAVGQGAALACLQQKNAHDLEALCRQENVDATALSALCSCSGTAEEILTQLQPMMVTPNMAQAWNQLRSLCQILRNSGFGDRIRVDFSVGNDLKYYSGVVFKGYLEGIPTSVLSGGQYDALLQKMGRRSSAIGFAIYTDLLERLEPKKAAFDVDTLLLHEADADPAMLLSAVEILSQKGSVLAATAKPENKRWRQLAQFSSGEVTVLEDNG